MAAAQFNNRTLMNFRNVLSGGGARSNLFECILNFPPNIGLDNLSATDKFRMLVKTAQLPASSIGTINVPFRGRNLKVAGDRTFDPWTVTVINDTDFTIRAAFERWMNYINRHGDNAGIINPSSYQANMDVLQLSRSTKDNNFTSGQVNETLSSDLRGGSADTYGVLRRYRFFGAYPSDLSAIDLSYDSPDDIQNFQITFQVQYWDVVSTTEGSPTASNSIIG